MCIIYGTFALATSYIYEKLSIFDYLFVSRVLTIFEICCSEHDIGRYNPTSTCWKADAVYARVYVWSCESLTQKFCFDRERIYNDNIEVIYFVRKASIESTY